MFVKNLFTADCYGHYIQHPESRSRRLSISTTTHKIL